MPDLACHTLIIGAGPGGYVCAIRAGQLGLDTVIVEADAEGGTCLNVGCIPSKALIHAADMFEQASQNAAGTKLGIKAGRPKLQFKMTIAWKDGIVDRLTGGVRSLLKKNKVRTIKGWARFMDGKTVDVNTGKETVRIRAANIVIATGSVPVELPGLPFGGNVISSAEALSLDAVPERLVVVGAGYIGLEMGIVFAKLGAEVTLVEASHSILPQYDSELTKPVLSRLEALGINLRLKTFARSYSEEEGGLHVQSSDDVEEIIPADKVLVTVGRRPLVDGWGREALVLDMAGASVRIDERCQTSMRGIFAIGDVSGEPMLAHRAMAQGEMVAEILAGDNRTWDKRVIPAICFTDPEIVSAGLSPEQAKAAGYKVKSMSFPFAANGRAMTMEREEGFIRIVAREDNHLILGIQAVGHGVSELAAGFGIAIEMGARLEDIASTVHAHPTLGEAFQEAALRGLKRAIHI